MGTDLLEIVTATPVVGCYHNGPKSCPLVCVSQWYHIATPPPRRRGLLLHPLWSVPAWWLVWPTECRVHVLTPGPQEAMRLQLSPFWNPETSMLWRSPCCPLEDGRPRVQSWGKCQWSHLDLPAPVKLSDNCSYRSGPRQDQWKSHLECQPTILGEIVNHWCLGMVCFLRKGTWKFPQSP